ncbi:hypothetical protein OG792_01500 [Micromonospora sp. NBC_01699]|uniref:hypothetical protein n=1 Tax=Micromonospora sp. NBC_01699 TaxID=2975984 RepID=UPI002E2D64FD|nr:hypothetical protein [Micromonospora sp. NBC_01699]
MESLRELADKLDEAAGTLTAAGRELGRADRARPALRVDGPGRLTGTIRALGEQWQAAIGARATEATLTADRVADLAATLRLVADGYADTDDAARRRHAREA